MTDIVFDIGGTTTRVATVVAEKLGRIEKFPTPADPDEGLRAVVEHTRAIAQGVVRRVAGCVAGNVVDGTIMGANNLVLWNAFPITSELEVLLGAPPVAVVNDAELAGVGECAYGAGKGFSKILYVTVSTGVGKARIVGGMPVYEEDPLKLSAELADLLDLEHSVSGTAVKNLYGIDPKNMSDEMRQDLAGQLAHGLKSSIDNFAPNALVLGGSMILGQNPIPLEPVEAGFPNVVVKKAALGDESGLWGGVAYLQQ